MASPEIGTPTGFFPLAASPSLVLAGGFQRMGGGSSQSRITKSKICEHTQFILYNVDVEC
jgi:hypothetical protein